MMKNKSAAWGCAIVAAIFVLILLVLLSPILWILLAGFLYESNYLYPDYVYRYRLTLNVEVEGIAHSASGVYEVHTKPGPDALNSFGTVGMPAAVGEAVALDLGEHGCLILLLRSRGKYSPAWVVRSDLAHNPERSDHWRDEAKSVADFKGSADIPENHLWTLVLLENKDNPSTMHEVDLDHPELTLGNSLKLLPAHVETTTDPVTTGIEDTLPWVKFAPTGAITRFNRPNAPFFYEFRDFEQGLR